MRNGIIAAAAQHTKPRAERSGRKGQADLEEDTDKKKKMH